MKKERITIDECGRLTVPTDKNGRIADIAMTEWEIAELFGVITPIVRAVIKAVYKSGVLREPDTKRYLLRENGNGIEVYDLEMIIALAFRIEAFGAAKLREYLLRRICNGGKRATSVNILLTCSHSADRSGDNPLPD